MGPNRPERGVSVARFDWYQATVRAAPGEVLEALGGLAAAGEWEHLQRAPLGYDIGKRLVDEDGQVCQLWWGGVHDNPHCVFSGETAPAGADLLRGGFAGRHSVSRSDVCIDYADVGAYDRLQAIALRVAEARHVKVGTAGDHLLTKEGRTVYLGGKGSHTRLRIYDKAAELRAKYDRNLVKLLEVPAHLARLEVQVRPQTPAAKAAAAIASPVELMGSAEWMRVLMFEVAGLELEPFQAGRVWRQSDDDRAYAAVLAQYGGMLKRRLRVHGTWACVGLQIGADLAERDAADRARGTGAGRPTSAKRPSD